MKKKDYPGFLESLGSRLEIQLLSSQCQDTLSPREYILKTRPTLGSSENKDLSNAVRIKKWILGLNNQLCVSVPMFTQASMSFQ